MGFYRCAEGLRELGRGVFENAAAAAGEPDFGAELRIARGDLLAEAGAATGDEDALAGKKAVLEHPSILRGVRGDSVTEGPVFARYFDEVHPHVLAPHPRLGEVIGDPAIEQPLLVDAAPGAEGDLDHHDAVGTRDPEKAVVFRHPTVSTSARCTASPSLCSGAAGF